MPGPFGVEEKQRGSTVYVEIRYGHDTWNVPRQDVASLARLLTEFLAFKGWT